MKTPWILALLGVVLLALVMRCSCAHEQVTQTAYVAVPADPVVQAPLVVTPAAPAVIYERDSGPGFVSGMLMGHMLSTPSYGYGGGYSRGSHHTTVINNTTVVNKRTYAPRISPVPSPRPTYRYVAPSSPRSSGWGARRR